MVFNIKNTKYQLFHLPFFLLVSLFCRFLRKYPIRPQRISWKFLRRLEIKSLWTMQNKIKIFSNLITFLETTLKPCVNAEIWKEMPKKTYWPTMNRNSVLKIEKYPTIRWTVPCKDKIPNFRNKYSQKRNIGVSVPISTFMRLWVINIFPRSVCLSCWRKYIDRSSDYINRSQTHECWNWGWGRAIPRKGIHKWDFRCSVAIVLLLFHFICA
jgi:hypothetical protein